MKILYVTSMLPFGSNEAFFIPEILALQHAGHRVIVVPMRPRGPVVHRDADAFLGDAWRVPLLSVRVLAGAAVTALRRPGRLVAVLRTLFRSRTPRILAKNLAVLPKGLWLARLARRLGVEHIHAQWAATSATMGFIASTVSGVPWSFTGHRWDIAEDNLIREKSGSAAFVRAIDARGGAALARLAGKASGKVRVIHMGVPRELLRPPRPSRGPDQRLRIVVAAHLVEVKGHAYAIDAMRLLVDRGVDAWLDVVGEGPLRGALARHAKALGLSRRVRFHGVVPHAELVARLRGGAWDLALLPSIVTGDGVQEGIPVFLVEAMACGVPVVSTETGGIPELVAGGAGVLVPPRDPLAIANAVHTLHAAPSEAERVARSALQRIAEAFTVEAAVERIGAAMTTLP